MSDITPESVAARDPPRFRVMMAVAFVAVVALACIIAAALLLWRAGEERGAFASRRFERPWPCRMRSTRRSRR